MTKPNSDPFRAILGQNLQTGALRAIIILGAFAFVGATLAWLVH